MIGPIKGCYTCHRKNHCHNDPLLPLSSVSKTNGEDLKQVLDVAVSMVNFKKQRLIKSCIFAKLCESMQKDHVTLFQHTDVRWLSRGKVLSRVFKLREELQLFFKDTNKETFLPFLMIQNGCGN
jgi:hypothetical protein